MVASQARPAYIYDTTLGDWVPMSGVVDTGQAYTFTANQTFNGLVNANNGINAATTLSLQTGGVNRLSIDSSGRVTAPSQPGFLAAISGNFGVAANGAIPPFNSVTIDARCFNSGGNYNISTYTFTAPVAGRYIFSHNSNVYNATGVIFMPGIRINGSAVIYGTRFATNISGDNNSSMSVIVNLAANDYVQPYLFVSSGMTLSGGSATWNSFSGVLLN
jgi:hypothetical protein